MSKISEYLNQHLLGEVLTDRADLDSRAGDSSVLSVRPEILVAPRTTNDVRKLAKFAWQLAEKGHVLPLVPRGGGTNTSGSAVGPGAIVDSSYYFTDVIELDLKQQLLHVQAGASIDAIRASLRLNGLGLSWTNRAAKSATIGGILSESHLAIEDVDSISQLEVVLANGDVIQTGRISKRDNKKKLGEPGFEGDIYRGIDKLYEAHGDLIDGLKNAPQSAGYPLLSEVKQKDGSVDLTPLFVGAQGTLGIITEAIVRTNVLPESWTVVVGAFYDPSQARDALDELETFPAARIEYIDTALLQLADRVGKQPSFWREATINANTPTTLIVVTLDDTSRSQHKRTKKLKKHFEKFSATAHVFGELDTPYLPDLAATMNVSFHNAFDGAAATALVDGVYVPLSRFDDFQKAIAVLSHSFGQTLAMFGDVQKQQWHVRPLVDLSKASGKQAALNFVKSFTEIVRNCGGSVASAHGEGRLIAAHSQKELDSETSALFAEVKHVFDPHNILNPNAKDGSDQPSVRFLRSSQPQTSDTRLSHF